MSVEAAQQVRTLIQQASRRLQDAGQSNARHEAEWLLGRLTGSRPLELYLREAPIPPQTVTVFEAEVEARALGTPLQYLLGEAEFCGEPFGVAPGVFIPRPETECLVQEVVAALGPRGPRRSPLRVLELGVGSGCIAISLAKQVEACVVVGVELSWKALEVARANVFRHGLAARIGLVQGSWVDPVSGRFDVVVSNPPYIPSARVDALPLDVRHEPRLSLDGGPDGMRDLTHLARALPERLAPGGLAAFECGEEQVVPLEDQLRRGGWAASVRPFQDLAGRPRGVVAVRATEEHGQAPH